MTIAPGIAGTWDFSGAPTDAAGRYTESFAACRHERTSGVYVIRDRRSSRVLYVGESHTGRLFDTVTRHFRKWKLYRDPQGRRFGGTTYDRELVRVSWARVPADQADEIQRALIAKLNPRDNEIEFPDPDDSDLPV